jgi:hypothetical protein
MPDINDIFDNAQVELSDFADKTERRMLKAIKALEEKIIDIMKDGFPENGKQLTLKAATDLQKQLVEIVQTDFAYNVQTITSEYEAIQGIIQKQFELAGLEVEFASVDKALVNQLESVIENNFMHLADEATEQIAQGLYNNVAGATSFSDFVDTIKTALTGLETTGGVPLSSYAGRYAQDSVMNFYQTMNLNLARRAKLTKFLYYGNVSKTTRAFCIARVGKTFTKEQIDKWNSYSWKGKSCDVWICRGGYNCRHHLMPVKTEWLDDGDLEVGNYFDENPDEYPDALKAEVSKELKKL